MFDILGVGVIVACGAMLLNGKGCDLLDFAKTTAGNIFDLIGGLFNNGQSTKETSQTQDASNDITNEVISSTAKLYSTATEVHQNGNLL